MKSLILGVGLALTFAAEASGQIGSEEVIVTATRLEQPSQTYSGSIASLSEVEISSVLAVHPAELLNRVAGVNIHRGSGQEHLTAIRSPVLTGGAGAGSFLYLEDGIPLRAAGFSNVNGLFESMSEIASGVEVVKGPGSVLYGSNAVHGLINVLSRSPETGGQGSLVISDDGYFKASGSVSSDQFRLSASLAHDNGFRDESGFDQQKVQLRWDEDFGPWSVRAVASYQNLNQETAGFIQGPEAYRDDEIRLTNPFPEAFRDGKSVRGSVQIARDLSDRRSVSITPYARWTDLRFLRHFVPGQALEENGHHSIGFVSALYWDDFIVGLDAELTSGFLDEFQENPSRFSFIQGEHYDYTVDASVLAGYAQWTKNLTKQTRLTAGVRAEYTDYDYSNKIDNGTFGRFQRVPDRSDDFWALTPKVSLNHTLSDQLNLYVRYARGARAPQTSDFYSLQINQVPGEVETETLDNFELGIKARSGPIRLDIAAFMMDKDNFFFRNANGFNVTNGQTSHLGVEGSFIWDASDWLRLSGDATVARHNYEFDDPASGIISGNRVDTAPETLAHLRARVLPSDGLWAEIEWRHVGEYFTDPANQNDYPGHDIFIARAEYALSEATQIFARVDNLFDTRYADRADFAFGNERYFPGRPRTMFLGIKGGF